MGEEKIYCPKCEKGDEKVEVMTFTTKCPKHYLEGHGKSPQAAIVVYLDALLKKK